MTGGRALLYASANVRHRARRAVGDQGAVPPELAAGAAVGFASGSCRRPRRRGSEVRRRDQPRRALPTPPRIALTFDDGPISSTPPASSTRSRRPARTPRSSSGRKLTGERAALARRMREADTRIGCHSSGTIVFPRFARVNECRDDLLQALKTIDESRRLDQAVPPADRHTNPTIARVAEELDLDVIGFGARLRRTSGARADRVIGGSSRAPRPAPSCSSTKRRARRLRPHRPQNPARHPRRGEDQILAAVTIDTLLDAQPRA